MNNLLHSMFNRIDVYFIQKLISSLNNTYAYRAYIKTLLNYGTKAKSSHLTIGSWYDDTAGLMAVFDRRNPGVVQKAVFVAERKMVDLIGHLNCDVFIQEIFLLNGVEAKLQLVHTCDLFCLMSSEVNNYILYIVEATLVARRAKISPGIFLAHA